jgi:hypothetical protein
LINHQITLVGHALRYFIVISFASAKFRLQQLSSTSQLPCLTIKLPPLQLQPDSTISTQIIAAENELMDSIEELVKCN